MLKIHEVRQVHLEVTDKCNASCPMCPRTDHGGPLNSRLRNVEMDLELAKKTFPESFLKQLQFIQLCGNFGDPIVAKDTLEILQYFRSANPGISLGIHTNGSLRIPAWWAHLGELLGQKGDYCKFALDGLEDTNHIYRRNTVWSKIMANAEAFIAAGGNAHWEFLVFRHNQHQVELAKEKAKAMGFKDFFLKKTSRFFNYQTGKNEAYPIFDKQKKVIGHLEPPDEPEFVNKVTLQADKPAEASAASVAPVEIEKKISCMSMNEKSIYISAAGEIFPCCFLGGQIQYEDRGPDGELLAQMCEKETAQGISTAKSSLESIFESNWFSSIQKSWSDPQHPLGTCHRLCTKEKLIVKSEYA